MPRWMNTFFEPRDRAYPPSSYRAPATSRRSDAYYDAYASSAYAYVDPPRRTRSSRAPRHYDNYPTDYDAYYTGRAGSSHSYGSHSSHSDHSSHSSTYPRYYYSSASGASTASSGASSRVPRTHAYAEPTRRYTYTQPDSPVSSSSSCSSYSSPSPRSPVSPVDVCFGGGDHQGHLFRAVRETRHSRRSERTHPTSEQDTKTTQKRVHWAAETKPPSPVRAHTHKSSSRHEPAREQRTYNAPYEYDDEVTRRQRKRSSRAY